MLAFYLSLADTPKDRRKIEILYHNYCHLMMHTARKILKKEEWAEDAVHDTILKLIGVLDRIDEQEIDSPRTKAFIYTITKNTALSFLKKEQRFFLEDLPEIPVDNLLDQVIAREYFERIAKLPEKLREPLLLSAYYGLSNRKIASLLGISEQLVHKRLKQARKRIESEESGHES